MKFGVNLVVALRAEAQPLIEHFELARVPGSNQIPLYQNQHLALVLSGIGKAAATGAVKYVESQFPDRNAAWLNVGIAGHGSLQIGDRFMADSIHERSSSKSWYPIFLFTPLCATGPLTSVDAVETAYDEATGYDMEAAAFIQSASQFATLELIHSFKIVSDNSKDSVNKLTRHTVAEFVRSSIFEIERTVESLNHLAAEVARRKAHIPDLEPFLHNWKFSVTQQHQLRKLLNKSRALGYDIEPVSDSIRDCIDSGSVIDELTQMLAMHWQRHRD